MKRFLLQMIALVAMVIEASAADPTYTTVGLTGNFTYDAGGYTSLVSSAKANVTVYGTDSIWVDNWCGVEGYGICVVLDSEGNVSSFKTVENGVSRERGSSSSYMWAYTGLSDNVDYGMYVPAWNNYHYITAKPGTAEDPSGYIEIWGYAYTSDDVSSSPYYFLGWGKYANYKAVGMTGHFSYDDLGYASLVSSTKADVKNYGSDSIRVDNWCGVEGYGICVVLDSAGHVSSFKTVENGVSRERGSSSSYMWAYTGLSDNVDYGMYLPAWNNYYYITANTGTAEDPSGYIEIWGYAYTSDNVSSSPYYYLGWGKYANYKAVGTTGNDNYNSLGYNPLINGTNADVKVYGTDSIWVDKWCGVEGYGISVVLDSAGHVSSIKTVENGVSRERGSSSSYMWAYTGLSDNVDYGIYLPAWNNYYYITATPGTVEDPSGYIEIWGYAYTSDNVSSSPYYYLGWGTYAATTSGIQSVRLQTDDDDAPMYNLAGQRVGKNAKGIVIKNGKKLLLK